MDLKEFFNSDLTFVADIRFKGRGVSFNEIYSSGTWYTRSRIKNKYKDIFDLLIKGDKDIRWMNEFVIDLSYNSKHDPDNVVAMEKIFVDTMRQERDKEKNVIKKGYFYDDSKRYCKGVILRPDESLPFNTFRFCLYEHGNKK